MNNSPYACSLCKRRFGRRWNAQRHNFTHFNQGEICDRFDNLVINLPLPQSKISVLGDNGANGFFQAGIKESNKNHNHNHMIGYPSIKNAIKRGVKSEDDVYDASLEKLVPIMGELDAVLSNYPQKERGCIRDMVIMVSMTSFDPLSNLKDILSFIKNNKLSNEIKDCISSFCNIPPSMAGLVLRNSILRKHKSDISADNADSGYMLQQTQQQQQQQQQQKPRPPPYYVSSLCKLKPIKSIGSKMQDRID